MAVCRGSITTVVRQLLRGSSSTACIRGQSHIERSCCAQNFKALSSTSVGSIQDPGSLADRSQRRSWDFNGTLADGRSFPASRLDLSQVCMHQIRSKILESWDHGRITVSFKAYSTSASGTPPPNPASDISSKEGRSGWTTRIGSLLKGTLSDLDTGHPSAMGLGLAGAIPFVVLTPPLCYLVPLPDLLQSSPIEAQAAYGAVILSFLGGPHWGLAMADYARNPARPTSHFGLTLRTLRYVWSVVPSLLAWPALLLPSVAKLSMLVVSFGFVLGIDAMFERMGLITSWYFRLRIILTLIAMLSLGSSLLITVAKKIPDALHHSDKSQQSE